MLVTALFMSFDAFLYPAGQTAIGQQTMAAAAKPHATQSASVPAAGAMRPTSPAVAEAATDDQQAGLENTILQRPRVRRLDHHARARDWVFKQETKALGYAEEPSASFLYDRFQ
jgi:hypothetical protein